MNKEMKQLVKRLKKQGIEVDQSGKHLKAHRKGRPKPYVVMPRTPSDHRSIKNTVADLRRVLGFNPNR